MSTPEGKVKDGISRVLKSLGIWFFKPVSNGMGAHGIPDFVCCVPTVITEAHLGRTLGVFMGIEAKAPGKLANVSPAQELQMRAVTAAGGLCFVTCDPGDVPSMVPK